MKLNEKHYYNNKAYALPHGKLMEILKKYNRAN